LFGFVFNLLDISTSCAEAFNQNKTKNINKINANMWAPSLHFAADSNVKLQINKMHGLHQITEQSLEM
jgi:hypothetical protein